MKAFLGEIRKRPGDWFFIPFLIAGIVLGDGWLIFGAFLIGALANMCWGARCKKHGERACTEPECR